eukprot:TRINITY_DN1700_c1_g1_i1.p1 TRINITY_DN1700_c1_g1~~TRINITY_DN1700_c1_g1_i1.p1  ORF type:complete len:940 (-),score=181.32 TRINITY_DN1700_c1_g1_i1:409-2808(-)
MAEAWLFTFGVLLVLPLAVRIWRQSVGLKAQPAKGKGKSKVRAAPPPKKMAANRPPGLGKASPPKPIDVTCLDDGSLSPRSQELRFGKKMHWVKPSCAEPQKDTVFGELESPKGTPRQLQFDKDLIDAMFSPRSRANSDVAPATPPRKSWTASKPQGLCLLDNSRAQNVAIILSKLVMSTEELCACILSLDTGHPRLRADNIELIADAMPTTSETSKLQANKDRASEMRDVERKLLPLCTLSSTHMKIFKIAMSHQTLHERLLERCQVVQRAASEMRNNEYFIELLAIVLKAGNYINSGGGEVRAFGIESLQSMASFKVGPISALHYLCLTMRASDKNFMPVLWQSLRNVRLAAKDQFSHLRGEIEQFVVESNYIHARLRERNAEAKMLLSNNEIDPAAAKGPNLQDDVCKNSADVGCFQQSKAAGANEADSCSSPKAATSAASGHSKSDRGNLCNEHEKDVVLRQQKSEVLSRDEDVARARLAVLSNDVARESEQLRLELAMAQQLAADTQAYFGTGQDKSLPSSRAPRSPTSARSVPPEQFFGYIQGFLDMLQETWREIERQPGRWRHFQKKADETQSPRFASDPANHTSDSVSPAVPSAGKAVVPRLNLSGGSWAGKTKVSDAKVLAGQPLRGRGPARQSKGSGRQTTPSFAEPQAERKSSNSSSCSSSNLPGVSSSEAVTTLAGAKECFAISDCDQSEGTSTCTTEQMEGVAKKRTAPSARRRVPPFPVNALAKGGATFTRDKDDQACEFHALDADSEVEFTKMADSDSESCTDTGDSSDERHGQASFLDRGVGG